jgi:hypothetical protein
MDSKKSAKIFLPIALNIDKVRVFCWAGQGSMLDSIH